MPCLKTSFVKWCNGRNITIRPDVAKTYRRTYVSRLEAFADLTCIFLIELRPVAATEPLVGLAYDEPKELVILPIDDKDSRTIIKKTHLYTTPRPRHIGRYTEDANVVDLQSC